MITKELVAAKVTAYLNHEITLSELAHWAAMAMMDEEFDEVDHDTILYVIERLGFADTKVMELSWTDLENMLDKLGYEATVELSAKK